VKTSNLRIPLLPSVTGEMPTPKPGCHTVPLNCD
jgi:hypothetical protein